MREITIAIDGYSSCGKSTFAKAIAKELNYTYIDSGAMYRVSTLIALRNNCIADEIDESKLLQLLNESKIEFRNVGKDTKEIFLNGENVETEIRGMEVASNVSKISTIEAVRTKMVDMQRQMRFDENNTPKGIVMDGRDIGTVVFEDAELKIFMTADPKIRAERRYKELIEKSMPASFDDILKNIEERDYIDTHRDVSPLTQAKDAIVLDNSDMTPPEQMEWVKDIVQERINGVN